MQAPKRKSTRSRTRHRRAHFKGSVPTYARCPRCQEPKLPHRVCPNCGHYAGRKVLEV